MWRIGGLQEMGVTVEIMVDSLLGCGRPGQITAFRRVGLLMGSKLGGCKGHVCPTVVLPSQRAQ